MVLSGGVSYYEPGMRAQQFDFNPLGVDWGGIEEIDPDMHYV